MPPTAQRDFLKLWSGQTISEIGSRITREGLPLTAVLLLSATPAQMGLLAAASASAVLFFSVAAGVIADRFRRRPLMIAADIARAALLATIPLAAWLHALTYPHLIGVAILAGILTVQFDVAYQTYLPSLVPPESLFEGNRRLSMSAAAAEILGPAITGVLIQLITAPIAILLDAASFLVSAFSVWAIESPETRPIPAPHESLWTEASQGARTIAGNPILRALTVRAVIAFFGMGLYFPLYLLYAIRDLHMSTALLGAVIAMGGVGAMLGAYLSTRIAGRFGVGPVFLASALLTAAVQFLIPLASVDTRYAALCLGAAQLIGDAGFMLYFVNETTLRQRIVPENVLGRVNAAMQLASRGVLPMGALAGGFLAAAYGMPVTLWLAAVIVLGSCVSLLPVARAGTLGATAATARSPSPSSTSSKP